MSILRQPVVTHYDICALIRISVAPVPQSADSSHFGSGLNTDTGKVHGTLSDENMRIYLSKSEGIQRTELENVWESSWMYGNLSLSLRWLISLRMPKEL